MPFKKMIFSFFIIAMTFFTSLSYAADFQGNPVTLLQTIADKMISGLKLNKATLKTKPRIVYELANKNVVPYAALPLMAKHVLPRQTWNNASDAMRQQFIKEFTTTLIRTYASALSAYKDQSVRFYPPRGPSKSIVEVKSEILSGEHEPIHVSYLLVHIGNNWRLFDLSVEGVSMLESFRAQFANILARGDMGKLLQRMGGHNRRKME